MPDAPVADPALIRRLDTGQAAYIYRGSVTFESAPGERGTMVRVEMSYVPPAGAVGAVVAKITPQSPERQVREDLRRFKQLMETGEVATTTGQSAGKRGAVYNLFKRERSA